MRYIAAEEAGRYALIDQREKRLVYLDQTYPCPFHFCPDLTALQAVTEDGPLCARDSSQGYGF
jgi:hypothetical protein